MGKTFVCALLMGASLLVLGGCFAYVPVEPEAAPVGHEVRVFITPEEMSALRDLDDQGLPETTGLPEVSGILEGRDRSSLAVRIPVTAGQNNFIRNPIFREIVIPSSSVVQLELRQLHRGRTALAVTTAGGVVATLAVLIIGDAQSRRLSTGPGDDDLQMRFPFLTLSVP